MTTNIAFSPPISKKAADIINAATPGWTAEQRGAFYRWLIRQPELTVNRSEVMTGQTSFTTIINPHIDGQNVSRLPITLQALRWPSEEQFMPVDHHPIEHACPPIGAEAEVRAERMLTDVVNHKAERKAVTDDRDSLITRVFNLKTKRAELLRDVAKISLEIAEADITLNQITFKRYVDRKNSRENDHA